MQPLLLTSSTPFYSYLYFYLAPLPPHLIPLLLYPHLSTSYPFQSPSMRSPILNSSSTLLLSSGYPILNERIIFAAMILLLFIGIKDDIMLISPSSKFGIQLLAAIAIVIIGDFRITNLHGIMGIMEINYFSSIAISILMVIAFMLLLAEACFSMSRTPYIVSLLVR